MASPLVVHHLESSRSQRTLWLLEELELDYTLERYARTSAGRAPAALERVHPLGKSPVIVHDGEVIAESGAIAEYLVDLAGGRLRPDPGTDEALRYTFFLHFAEGSVMPPLIVKLITRRLRDAIPLLGKLVAGRIDGAYTDAEIHRHLSFVEAELDGREWIVGDALTAADTLMVFPLQASLARGGQRARYPRVARYVERIEARPAYQRALERGGKFELL